MPPHLDEVLTAIGFQECVVFLGPNIPKDRNGNLLSDAALKALQQSIAVERDSEGLLQFGPSRRDQTRYHGLHRKFVEEEAVISEIHRKLADLPIHLYVSLTPDYLLGQAFEEKGLEYEFSYYHKGRPQVRLQGLPTVDKPLIYNMFGSIEERDSLVYTQDSLFDFIFSILGPEFPIAGNLIHAIKSASLFLFLGFEFDRWYLKVLLRLFELHQDPFVLAAAANQPRGSVQAFYEKQFGMVFVDGSAEQYVEALHAKWPTLKKSFRKSAQERKPIEERILTCLENDELEAGLNLLREFLEDRNSPAQKDVPQLKARYNGIQRKLYTGTLTQQQASAERAQVREGIRFFVNQEI